MLENPSVSQTLLTNASPDTPVLQQFTESEISSLHPQM